MQSDTIQGLLVTATLALGASAFAQAPVDDDGNLIGDVERLDQTSSYAVGGGDLSNAELELLVNRVALYPDDLLAIVLPASTYPLQVAEAGRFLDDVEDDPSLKPDEDWDDSIVALINYPEVVELLNEDLDWTYALGEAFIAQQEDLLAAVDSFRDRAYAAGNLKTDEYQRVEENDAGIIEIEPVNDDVIYVPYYEPERVVVYQTRPVYRYYANPYPVYYYPYADSWYYHRPFYGLTTAFTIGWVSHSIHVLHHSHYHHPYYGRHYYDRWWYRRPSIHVHNSIYVGNYGRRHYRYGDYWRPRHSHRVRLHGNRVTRSRHYGNRQRDYVRREHVRNDYRRRDAGTVTRNRAASGRTTDGNRRIAQSNTNRVDARRQVRSDTPASRRPSNNIQRERREIQREPSRRSNRSDAVQRRDVQRSASRSQRRESTVSPRELRGRTSVQSPRRNNIERQRPTQRSQSVRRPSESAPRRAAPQRSQSRPSPRPAQRVERRSSGSREASSPRREAKSSRPSQSRSSKSQSSKSRSERSPRRGQDRRR